MKDKLFVATMTSLRSGGEFEVYIAANDWKEAIELLVSNEPDSKLTDLCIKEEKVISRFSSGDEIYSSSIVDILKKYISISKNKLISWNQHVFNLGDGFQLIINGKALDSEYIWTTLMRYGRYISAYSINLSQQDSIEVTAGILESDMTNFITRNNNDTGRI